MTTERLMLAGQPTGRIITYNQHMQTQNLTQHNYDFIAYLMQR